jgi:anti-repressor protein
METQIFKYKDNVKHTKIDENEQMWFAGIVGCNHLDNSNSYQTFIKLDEDERKPGYNTNCQGKQKETLTINEYGMFSLILSSTKPEAKAFKNWVTHEVMPSIRKSGFPKESEE